VIGEGGWMRAFRQDFWERWRVRRLGSICECMHMCEDMIAVDIYPLKLAEGPFAELFGPSVCPSVRHISAHDLKTFPEHSSPYARFHAIS